MIQLITKRNNIFKDENIKANDLNNFESFDDYDINIIDLSSNLFWQARDTKLTSTINDRDLQSLHCEIENTNNKVLILLPQNQNFSYHRNYENKSAKIKDIIPNCKNIIVQNLYNIDFELEYGSTVSQVNDLEIHSDFYIRAKDSYQIITKSINGNRTTTICQGNIYTTTLNVMSNKEAFDSIISLLNNNVDKETPDWIKEYNFNDDEDLKTELLNQKKQKEMIVQKINDLTQKIDSNNAIKKVLYESGEELVQAVFSILEKLLICNLSDFEDECEEDFLIKKNELVFIGEIKGINTNIKREHINQTDNHVQMYLDKIEESKTKEEVKGILIINYQRNREIKDRDEVTDSVISIAKRNEILIIPTNSLLDIYDMFLKEKLSTQDVIEMFKSQIGLINTNGNK